MLALLKYWQIGAGAAVGALLAAGPVYLYGAAHGRQQAALSAAEATVAAISKRGDVDEKIIGMDGYRLCLELGGGMPECADQLRRVEADKP
ncbi:hypothetical protein GCM10011491_31260 [Brucella endophytica]|uniref:Uncharacterized protein n=1 Tax=Brucella endophytica TaxID=1963359 RepID=A0A916SJK9_9HYPH|nr:hypothetical protein [Brucella endophytica]GGB00813.1 hypothetical protein GCM10011491_31260 [Brucella endophytica]